MKYFATFKPAIVIEFNNKQYVMKTTKKYATSKELFTVLAAHSESIVNTKVQLLAQKDDGRTTSFY